MPQDSFEEIIEYLHQNNGEKYNLHKASEEMQELGLVLNQYLLKPTKVDAGDNGKRTLVLHQQCTPEQEKGGLLKTVFLNGELINRQTLAEIRQRLNSSQI